MTSRVDRETNQIIIHALVDGDDPETINGILELADLDDNHIGDRFPDYQRAYQDPDHKE
jgi:hypothetical protein